MSAEKEKYTAVENILSVGAFYVVTCIIIYQFKRRGKIINLHNGIPEGYVRPEGSRLTLKKKLGRRKGCHPLCFLVLEQRSVSSCQTSKMRRSRGGEKFSLSTFKKSKVELDFCPEVQIVV